MTVSYATRWTRVSSALSAFWEGGAGPTRSNVIRAMGAAGIDNKSIWDGNKSDLIVKAFKSGGVSERKLLVTELVDLLASEANFDDSLSGYESRKVEKLRAELQTVGCDLRDDGTAIWTEQITHNEPQLTPLPAHTPTASVTLADPVPSPVLAAKPPKAEKVWGPSVQFLVEVLRDLPAAAMSLTRKRRGEKINIEVWDEYDVQDFIEMALRLHYKDVRPENATPPIGGNSSRVDFFIREEQVVVEAKVAHTKHANKAITDELIIDISRYQAMPGLKDLICVVYDLDGSLKNPAGFEFDLEALPSGDLRVHVVATKWPFSARPPAGATKNANSALTASSR